jgi:hypothetical protein
MRTSTLAFQAGLLLLASTTICAQEPPARPAPPVVTVGANLKELTFDWDPVPGAAIYRLMQNSAAHGYFEPIGDRLPASRTRTAVPIAVHQQNWAFTRYLVLACNPAGCTRSNEVFPQDLMLDTIGYVKAPNTGSGDRFGRSVALSVDGSTMVVSAEREDSSATGVNGNQADNDSSNSGAVYVYRRTGRRWAQEAYLKAGINHPGQAFGYSKAVGLKTLALSYDGSLLAVGAPGQGTSTAANQGAVYLFARAADNTWHLATTLRAPTPLAGDYFGYSVDMSEDGRTLKVSSLLPLDQYGVAEGRTHIFVRPASTWQHSVALAPYYAGDNCHTVRMSGNGRTLVASCFPPSIGYGRAVTLRLINGSWLRVSEDIPLHVWMSKQPIALSYHGDRLALNRGAGNDSGLNSAWIGLYRWENDSWVLEGYLGSARPWTQPISEGWGQALEFDRHGEYVAVSDYGAPFAGAGIIPNLVEHNESHGLVYLYRRNLASNPIWTAPTLIKAPNPAAGDYFGTSVALSGNARILAIGAVGEDSAATGIDGNQLSNSSTDSGAVYLY